MSKVFGKLRNCALKAKKVFVIAPSRTGHLDGWKDFFEASGYKQTAWESRTVIQQNRLAT